MKPASLTAKDLAYPLDSLALDDLTLAGGKASKLSSLKRAGFPVPDGFVLTTEAYQVFVEYNALSAAIAAHMASVSPEKPETAEAAAQAIRSQLSQGRIPNEVVAAVQHIYQQMHPGDLAPPVAVRSSATAEDLPEASFAGQHESFLNVRSEATMLEAVKGCWASLWTAQAIAYRVWQQINPLQVRMAVIIQVMAPADSAGVLFTINPLTANKDEMLINAAWGLGESLVSGQVAPDTITLDKETGEVKASALGAKQVMSVPATQGTELIETTAAQRQAAVVSPAQIEILADLGRGVEAYFGTAQDIEWAVAGDEVYLLQARPVTAVGRLRVTLPQSQLYIPGDDRWLPEGQSVVQPFDLWTRANFGEVLPNPLSPLTLSGFQLVGEKMASNDKKDSEPNIEMTRRIYGRLYANEGGMRHAVAAMGLPTALLNTLWGIRRPDLGSQSRFRPFRLLSKIPGIFKGMSQIQQQSQAGTTEPLPPKDDALYSRIDQWLAAFQDRDLHAYSDADLWQEARNVWEERRSQMFQRHALVSQKAFFMFIPLERVTGRWAGDTKLAQRLTTGISGIHAAEIGPQLWRIAQRAQELGVAHLVTENTPNAALTHLETTPQARPVVEQLALFLSEHGHRCPAEAEIMLPRWAEAPEHVVELIAGYLRASDGVNPVAAETAQRVMRETTQAEIAGAKEGRVTTSWKSQREV